MSRKDYEKFARMIRSEVEAIKAWKSPEVRDEALNHLSDTANLCARVFKEDNPSFDKLRFLTACGVE